MNAPAAVHPVLRRRRWVVATASVTVVLVLGLALGHPGQHMLRSLLLPGAGLYDQHLLLGLAFTVAAVVATVGWVRWGTDWALVAVVLTSVASSGLLGDAHHAGEATSLFRPVPAAHEFPLVIIVVGMLGWCRGVLRRVPVVRRWRGRVTRERQGIDDIAALRPVDRCRAAAVAALADGWSSATAARITAALTAPDVALRCRRVGAVARGRLGGDPLRRDHAHARAALSTWGLLDGAALGRFRAESMATWSGVPHSEPGWVRLLDGTLAALALERSDPAVAERWRAALAGEFALRRGHRPTAVWAPLGVRLGRADDWEHVASSALARIAGWVDDEDWAVLRQRCLGAAARGSAHPADERTIAAARIWAVLTVDEDAARLLARPTVRRDPLAVALDQLAVRADGLVRGRRAAVGERPIEGASA